MSADEVRIAKADRDRALERLGTALHEERLDVFEYNERAELVAAAKSFDDLNQAMTGLPSKEVAGNFTTLGVWLAVAAVTTMIWLIESAISRSWVFFWPGIVVLAWAVVIATSLVVDALRQAPRNG
jgi:Domain of unknown function (DUF1707)